MIAPQSAAAIRNSDENENQFAARLGVNFALDGSVQRVGDRVRASVRLVELQKGETLWADRFEGEAGDIFAFQDRISNLIANTLIGKLADQHTSTSQAQAPRDFGAYDHVLRAQRLIWNASQTAMIEARVEVEKALTLDPEFARAYVLLSWIELTEDSNGWGAQGDMQYVEAVESARRAVALNPLSAWARSLYGTSLFWRDRDASRALEECSRGVELNPSNAHLRMFRGATLAYSGDGDAAEIELNKAMEINPLFPNLYLMHRARAHFVRGDDVAALRDMQIAAEAFPDHSNAHAMLAVCLASLGRSEEAELAVQRVSALSPTFTVAHARRSSPYCQAAHGDRFCDLLEQAGLPKD